MARMGYDGMGRVMQPQGMGDLDFRDIRLVNIALLGRQVWHLINHNDTLCFQVLSSNIFWTAMCYT